MSLPIKTESSPKLLTLRWVYARHIGLFLEGGLAIAMDAAAHKRRQPTTYPRGGLRLAFLVQDGLFI